MKRERKNVCTAQKIGFCIFLGVLLPAYTLVFWSEAVFDVFPFGGPFISVLMYAVVFAISEQFWGALLCLILYFLMGIILIVFFSMATFRKQKWIVPFNTMLGIDMIISLLTANFSTILIDLFLIIGANIVVYKLDDSC